MTIDTKRLATDAAYWVECGAPEWAAFAAHKDGVFAFVNQIFGFNDDSGLRFIPRPQGPETQWDGLSAPAPGELARTSGGKCQVLGWDAQSDKIAVQWHDGELGVVSLTTLKPLRTKEQRQKEELISLLSEYSFDIGSDYESAADAILSRYNLDPKP